MVELKREAGEPGLFSFPEKGNGLGGNHGGKVTLIEFCQLGGKAGGVESEKAPEE